MSDADSIVSEGAGGAEGAKAGAGDAPGRTINTYSLRAGVASNEEGKLDISILSNIDELIQTITLGVYDVTMNNPTMIFSMEQDAYAPMKLKDDQLRSLSYTFMHDDQQRYIHVTRAEDAGGGATEGRGLKIKMTLATDDESWHAEVIDPGHGYADSDIIKIYGNIAGLNLYLALGIRSGMSAENVQGLFEEVSAADYHYKAEYGPICRGLSYSGRIEWNTVRSVTRPWQASFAGYTRGQVQDYGFHALQLTDAKGVDDLTRKLFENEQKAGMSADNGEGLKVLSKILGSGPVREFRTTVLLTGTGPSFQAGGPVDKLMDGLNVQYVAGLSSVKEAATRLPGTYVQSGFAFDKLQFKRFGGVVTDEASFTARVRPMIPDEHFAAVSAHLSGLSDGSIVRPKYIKDYIKKL